VRAGAGGTSRAATGEERCPPPPPDQRPIPFGVQTLRAICRDAYADPAASPVELAGFARQVLTARRGLTEAFGSIASEPPIVIFCKTAACNVDFAGSSQRARVLRPGQRVSGSRYVNRARTTVVMTGQDARTLLHELVHVEMLDRLHGAWLPDWFHEGLAVSIGRQSMCDPRPPRAIDDLRRLDRVWAAFTDHHFGERMRAAYCQAFSEVDAWRHRHGRQRLLALIRAVRSGTPFYVAYGPLLTQAADTLSSEDRSYDGALVLSNATPGEVVLGGAADSFARSYGHAELAEGERPFSIELWIKPGAHAGTLVHASVGPSGGSGWCLPLLGFNGAGRLVAQVLQAPSPDRFAAAVSPAPLPRDGWTHVAMTWAPRASLRLYSGGVLRADTAAPRHLGAGRGALVYLTWGASNLEGGDCWSGEVRPGGFRGSLRGMTVHRRALTAEEVAARARAHPSR